MGKIMVFNYINYLEEIYRGERECPPIAEDAIKRYKAIRQSIPDDHIKCIGCPTTRMNYDCKMDIKIDRCCFTEEQDNCLSGVFDCADATGSIIEAAGGAYYQLLVIAKEMEVMYGALE